MKKRNIKGILSLYFLFLLGAVYRIRYTVYAQDPIGLISPKISGIFSTNPVDPSTGQLTGVIILMNLVLRIIFIVAGIWTFLNFIIAGFDFMSASGDSKKVASAWTRIWQSLVGLVIIVASFLVAAIIGLVLYGNVGAILNPTIAPTP